MNLELTDDIALVIGGASGIGLAAAHAFAAEGTHVVIWDCSEHVAAKAKEVQDALTIRAAGITVDVSSSDSVRAGMEETIARFGRVDHVVHAAAVGSGKFGFPFTRLKPSDWKRVLDVNVMGMVHIADAVVPHMVDCRSGTIVFVASVAGQIGSQTDPPYSASKAANINFAQCIAKDLACEGIRVNTVCPGMVRTPLNQSVWQSWYDQAPKADRVSYDEWAEQKIRTLTPLGKWQTPQAIADMIVFLSSARAAHVTGQTINVDGGQVMHS